MVQCQKVRKYGISSEFVTVVPRNANCELWSLKIKNNTERKRSIRAIVFCGSDFDEAYARQGYNLGVAKFDKSLNGIVTESRKTFAGVKKGLCYGFMAASETVDGYDCTRNAIAIVNYVFGLQPEMEGLRIDPCLPPRWKNCSITKEFRGCTYHIEYENRGSFVKEININGKVFDGTVLPVLSGNVDVKVVTGKEACE